MTISPFDLALIKLKIEGVRFLVKYGAGTAMPRCIFVWRESDIFASHIVDADGALDRLRTAGAAGVHEFHVYGVLPGEPVDSGSRRLDYISNNVLPSLRLGGSAPAAEQEEEGMNVE